jgi:hypothetical protein
MYVHLGRIGKAVVVQSFKELSRNSCEWTDIDRDDFRYRLVIKFFFIWFVRLLALRPILAYCATLG